MSTYTTNKYIEQQDINALNWGGPLNTDLASIDTAFGGHTTFNMTTYTSPTTVTLAVSDYRPPIWLIQNMLSYNVTLQIPSGVGGIWVINNSATYNGTPTLTVSSAGGGTSVVIPANSKSFIYCDGTNVQLAGGAAAGSNTQVQYNSGSVLAGSGNFVFDGTNVGIGTSTPGARLDVKSTIRLSGSSSGYVGLSAAAAAGSTTYTLPSVDGSAGQLLSTNGSGVLSWASLVTGVSSVSGGSTGLTPASATAGAITLGGTLNVASGGTGATDAATARSNLGVPSTSGTGASGTWGISITGNAQTLGGLSLAAGSSAPAASTVLRSDSSGFCFFNYINSNTLNSENPGVSQVIVTNGSDNYYRKSSIASFTSYVQSNASGSWAINVTGSSASLVTSNNYQMNSLGVNTAASGSAGEIRATGNITAYYSDDRLKTRLGDINNALRKVCSLTGFYYEANETAQALGYKPKREVGLSAQDVYQVLPEVVSPAPIDDKYWTMDYARVVPLLVEAIKEQQTIIDALRTAIEDL